MMNPLGYYSDWVSAERAGYSGVATFSKEKAIHVQKELNNGRHDGEGRLLLSEFEVPGVPGGTVTVVNLYLPNGGQGDHRFHLVQHAKD
jgi:exodeoxyribonuclease-3